MIETMKHKVCKWFKITLCYILAGATQILVKSYPNFQGHPHVPFSGFPEFLVFSPFAPLRIFFGSFDEIYSFLVFCGAFIFFYFLLFKSPRSKQ